jgi:hypothetical protein
MHAKQVRRHGSLKIFFGSLCLCVNPYVRFSRIRLSNDLLPLRHRSENDALRIHHTQSMIANIGHNQNFRSSDFYNRHTLIRPVDLPLLTFQGCP